MLAAQVFGRMSQIIQPAIIAYPAHSCILRAKWIETGGCDSDVDSPDLILERAPRRADSDTP